MSLLPSSASRHLSACRPPFRHPFLTFTCISTHQPTSTLPLTRTFVHAACIPAHGGLCPSGATVFSYGILRAAYSVRSPQARAMLHCRRLSNVTGQNSKDARPPDATGQRGGWRRGKAGRCLRRLGECWWWHPKAGLVTSRSMVSYVSLNDFMCLAQLFYMSRSIDSYVSLSWHPTAGLVTTACRRS